MKKVIRSLLKREPIDWWDMIEGLSKLLAVVVVTTVFFVGFFLGHIL